MTKDCVTKYPILLIHGTGFRDDNPFYNYWGRIPKILKENGATIFYSRQDAWATIEVNGKNIRNQLEDIIENEKIEKVNIIAHSKGGLEARYLISSLRMEKFIASLTMISTPHHGSRTIDIIWRLPKFVIKIIGFFVNLTFKFLGDKRPDFSGTLYQFTTSYCEDFNKKNMDYPGIKYQSYAGKMKNAFSDLMFFFSFLIIKIIEGENDGLVTIESAKWGIFKGKLENEKNRGISHSDEVDLWRKDLSGYDITSVYKQIVHDLKSNGM